MSVNSAVSKWVFQITLIRYLQCNKGMTSSQASTCVFDLHEESILEVFNSIQRKLWDATVEENV